MIDITELRDGGQDAESIAAKIASFLSPATRSLELALYDVHLESEHAAPIHAALTGSTNWTDESWSREENLIAIIDSKELALRYRQNFEELWQKRDVERSGHVDSAPIDIEGHRVRPWFAPGHGEAVAHRIARRLGQAKRRIRIASPVLTSGPILGTLAELIGDHRRSPVDI